MIKQQQLNKFQLGIQSEYTRKKLLVGVEETMARQESLRTKIMGVEGGAGAPSAPPSSLDDTAPSAPPSGGEPPPLAASAPPLETFQSAECVVCLERKVASRILDGPVLVFNCLKQILYFVTFYIYSLLHVLHYSLYTFSIDCSCLLKSRKRLHSAIN